MSSMAGAPDLSELASSSILHSEEMAIVAELKSGSEEAFTWLIARYSQQVYSLVYRMLDDPSDAADTTQEVFIKDIPWHSGLQLTLQPEDLDLPDRPP